MPLPNVPGSSAPLSFPSGSPSAFRQTFNAFQPQQRRMFCRRGRSLVMGACLLSVSLLSVSLMNALLGATAAADQPKTAEGDAAAHDKAEKNLLSAVERSLPYIAERGQWWIDRKKCISCHRTTFSIWAVSAAADAGLDVDESQLEQWVDWSYESLLTPDDEGTLVATKNLDGVAQLLHVTRERNADAARQSQRDQLAELLRDGQQDDGSWSPAGQLPSQKRPKPETTWVSTAWARFYTSTEELSVEGQQQASDFLKSPSSAASTEQLVIHYLTCVPAERGGLLKTLLAEQNEDGGWGWLRSQESDAMATGQVLYALAHSAGTTTTAARQRAVQFLVNGQQSDGRWEVKGTKKNKQDRIEETATYWGTCWAVIGMLESARQDAVVSDTASAAEATEKGPAQPTLGDGEGQR